MFVCPKVHVGKRAAMRGGSQARSLCPRPGRLLGLRRSFYPTVRRRRQSAASSRPRRLLRVAGCLARPARVGRAAGVKARMVSRPCPSDVWVELQGATGGSNPARRRVREAGTRQLRPLTIRAGPPSAFHHRPIPLRAIARGTVGPGKNFSLNGVCRWQQRRAEGLVHDFFMLREGIFTPLSHRGLTMRQRTLP